MYSIRQFLHYGRETMGSESSLSLAQARWIQQQGVAPNPSSFSSSWLLPPPPAEPDDWDSAATRTGTCGPSSPDQSAYCSHGQAELGWGSRYSFSTGPEWNHHRGQGSELLLFFIRISLFKYRLHFVIYVFEGKTGTFECSKSFLLLDTSTFNQALKKCVAYEMLYSKLHDAGNTEPMLQKMNIIQ